MATRLIKQIKSSHASSDGAGVKIQRTTGFGGNILDPFLLLDEIHSDNPGDFIGGFPPHPHRGFETLTYMIQGSMQHEDHMGNKGLIHSGGAQWMSAGKGVIHSEMPAREQGVLHGFQLWINLPAERKMKQPEYRDVASHEMSVYEFEQGKLVVVAGKWQFDGQTLQGPLQQISADAGLADLHLSQGQHFQLATDTAEQLLVYVYQGQLAIGQQSVKAQQMAVTNKGNGLHITALEHVKLLLLKGIPVNEPIAHYGPFVMNTQAEIEQALADYQHDRLTK